MTHSKPLRAEAKPTKGAVTKSDHRVSAEGLAAKTVQLGTKIETSLMHPPAQGHGEELSQAQSSEIDFNGDTQQEDRKKSEDEKKEDNVAKHTEEEADKGEKYQLLVQKDEQMDDGNQDVCSEDLLTGPEEGQTLHEESYQVLDSVDDEDQGRPEEKSEIEMDGSLPVQESVTNDQAATSQEDSRLSVQNDGSTLKQHLVHIFLMMKFVKLEYG